LVKNILMKKLTVILEDKLKCILWDSRLSCSDLRYVDIVLLTNGWSQRERFVIWETDEPTCRQPHD
jgi:hypothetical protein